MLAGRTARDEEFNRMARNIVGSKLSRESSKSCCGTSGTAAKSTKTSPA